MSSRKNDQTCSTLNRRRFIAAVSSSALLRADPTQANTKRDAYLVPNFHPASCGWLTTFSKERVYCANSYLNHLDRVRDDPQYEFVMSEANNVIAIMNFRPERIPELKQRISERRVELVNGFFLESTINLSGGEALVRLGVEGLRWYQRVLGAQPRHSWNIDVCGTHEQMPQIASGLGLETLVYTRKNPTGKSLFWSVSPDGTKILTLCPGHYSELKSIFTTKTPLTPEQLNEVNAFLDAKEAITPEKAPILILAGADDYALAPILTSYPSELLEDWSKADLGRKLRFSELGKYIDAIMPGINTGKIPIPTFLGGTGYDFDAFWIENPEVKTRFRRNEHALQAAEILATIASLEGTYEYPVKTLDNSWILMCLSMDRNTLWGSAGGMVFEDAQSWDVQDRLQWVANASNETLNTSERSLFGTGESVGLFNPLNWHRNDPVALRLPSGTRLEGAACEALLGGSTLCQLEMPSVSAGTWNLSKQPPQQPRRIELPQKIETAHYSVQVDGKTGALTSLKLKKSGRELLQAPGGVIVAERPSNAARHEDPGDKMPSRPGRSRLLTSSDHATNIKVTEGPVAITVEATGTFYGGGAIRRVIRFYNNHPRIDFETELNDVPNFTVVTAEFPLSEDVTDIRRGIPFGFSHGAWSKPNPNLHGWTKGIVPAVRWIDYTLAGGGGVALLDRGCSGRELDNKTALIYLLNAEDKYNGYSNPWLSGKGKHILAYALVPHETGWLQARIPQMAWEYNREPVALDGVSSKPIRSFLETSDNVIIEAIRREGDHIELRLVECLGARATASVRLTLPHKTALFTDLIGRAKSRLEKSEQYTFPVRPQQIVTMQFETESALSTPEPIQAWDPFVPRHKLPALHAYDPKLIGHPPFGA